MNRDEVLKVFRAHKATLSRRFGVTNLALFGSVARDEMSDDSDIDILVRSTDRERQKPTSACSFTWRTCWVIRSFDPTKGWCAVRTLQQA